MALSVLSNKDYRSIIDPYLDSFDLHVLLLAIYCDYRQKASKREVRQSRRKAEYKLERSRYPKTVKTLLKAKAIQVKIAWNFYNRSPDVLIPFNTIHPKTRENLRKMENEYGFRWKQKMCCWFVPRGQSTPGKDLMMIGSHPEFGRVQYWRHETKNPQSGDTFFLYYDKNGKKIKERVHPWFRKMKRNGT